VVEPRLEILDQDAVGRQLGVLGARHGRGQHPAAVVASAAGPDGDRHADVHGRVLVEETATALQAFVDLVHQVDPVAVGLGAQCVAVAVQVVQRLVAGAERIARPRLEVALVDALEPIAQPVGGLLLHRGAAGERAEQGEQPDGVPEHGVSMSGAGATRQ
jgi:hypothetical protein